jgi:hypothetical protein
MQILEFGLVAMMFFPLAMGTFITGMNVIRSIQANHMARDLANMYIHGANFSDPGIQRVAKKLATGLGLTLGPATTNSNDNVGTSGRGIVWISKVMRIGGPTDAHCAVTPSPSSCPNQNKFVFLEHIRFGNSTLQSERDASTGHPGACVIDTTSGRVLDDFTMTPGCALPDPQQTAYRNLWQTTSGGRTALVDGQVLYIAEVYFQSPDLNFGPFRGNGVYARWFF